MSETSAIITAIATLVTALTAFVSVVVNSRRIKDVKNEVKTGNSQTIAQLTDAVETRRIDKIPPKKRTRLEKSHVKETR